MIVFSFFQLHDVYKKVCTKRNLASLDISEFISVAELVESRGAIRIVGKIKNRLSKVRQTFFFLLIVVSYLLKL